MRTSFPHIHNLAANHNSFGEDLMFGGLIELKKMWHCTCCINDDGYSHKKRAGLLFPGGIGYITLDYETTADLVKDGNDTIPIKSLY